MVSVFEAIITGDRCQARVRDDAFAVRRREGPSNRRGPPGGGPSRVRRARLFTPGPAAEPDPIKRESWPSVVRVYAVTHRRPYVWRGRYREEYDRSGIGGER